jgi:hypothetical protein
MEQEIEQDKKSSLFYRVLRQNSVSQEDPIPEWKVVHHVDGDGSSKCICSTPILYQHTIENTLNGRQLIIGSECVKRWNVKFICEECQSPLGNITQRLIKKNFLCPECTRERKRKQKLLEVKREARKARLAHMLLDKPGRYYNAPFCVIINDLVYVQYLINMEPKNYLLRLFEEYVEFYYDIVTETIEEEI